MTQVLRQEKCSFDLVAFARPYCSYFQQMSPETKEAHESADTAPQQVALFRWKSHIHLARSPGSMPRDSLRWLNQKAFTAFLKKEWNSACFGDWKTPQ